MVQACCKRCYDKYIKIDDNKEKVIDESFLKKNFGENYKIVIEPKELELGWKEFLKKNGHELPQDTFVVTDETKENLCMCECHVHGLCVFH